MVKVEFKNLKKVQKDFRDMSERMKNSKPGMNTVSARAYKDVIEHFSKEEGGDGKKWPKWTKKTKSGRKVLNKRPSGRGGSKLLQDTGFLRLSIRFLSTARDAIVYVKTKYGEYHQKGTPKMQKRKFMWASYKFRKWASRYYGGFISGRVR